MSTKVATVTEVLRITPETLRTFDISELERLNGILEGATTKPAKNKAYQIGEIIKAMQKEQRSASKPEPVANSAKSAKPEAGVAKSASATAPGKTAGKSGAAAKARATIKPTPAKPAAPATPPSAAASKPAAPGKKKLEDMDKEELIAALKQNEKFPEVVPGPDNTREFIKLDVESVGDLCRHIARDPFGIYMIMDEHCGDNLTLFLVPYASDKVIIAVDKNREQETFLALDPISIKTMTHEEKEGNKVKFTMPFAFYKSQTIVE